MREIKYKYCYGGKILDVGKIEFFTDGSIHVNSELIGGVLLQYTGLKDKNGVEIYEGDIIKRHNKWPGKRFDIFPSIDRFCKEIGFTLIEVKWTGETNGYSNRLTHWFNTWEIEGEYFAGGNVIEVIGNIYENPELLEGKK